eukprot:CAMPEP_0206030782 /NCGR_PEP_ID=MMETSP1464-20131121/47690_1 /ASSEMBLY_ACC=CAM_ASM_001124 /TAXON_ID=119497 /ORGANISM="Exanthemachrysis gayraliae, Strain RCC1523" /LENGTH=482 /DNA_ID=CAMNT_0053404889 /DNA_START=146 /DNA_END=1593 /DNA_ORIENTATION=-
MDRLRGQQHYARPPKAIEHTRRRMVAQGQQNHVEDGRSDSIRHHAWECANASLHIERKIDIGVPLTSGATRSLGIVGGALAASHALANRCSAWRSAGVRVPGDHMRPFARGRLLLAAVLGGAQLHEAFSQLWLRRRVRNEVLEDGALPFSPQGVEHPSPRLRAMSDISLIRSASYLLSMQLSSRWRLRRWRFSSSRRQHSSATAAAARRRLSTAQELRCPCPGLQQPNSSMAGLVGDLVGVFCFRSGLRSASVPACGQNRKTAGRRWTSRVRRRGGARPANPLGTAIAGRAKNLRAVPKKVDHDRMKRESDCLRRLSEALATAMAASQQPLGSEASLPGARAGVELEVDCGQECWDGLPLREVLLDESRNLGAEVSLQQLQRSVVGRLEQEDVLLGRRVERPQGVAPVDHVDAVAREAARRLAELRNLLPEHRLEALGGDSAATKACLASSRSAAAFAASALAAAAAASLAAPAAEAPSPPC